VNLDMNLVFRFSGRFFFLVLFWNDNLLGINGTGRMSLLCSQQFQSTEGNTKRRPQPVNISHWSLISSFLHPPLDC